MLQPTHIAETVLYVSELGRAIRFYSDLFECPVLRRDDRLGALRIAPEEVLLLFLRGASLQPGHVPGGMIPPHDGSGPLHVCFGIGAADVDAWRRRLTEQGIALESEVHWPGGATSLYFRDPDQNAVELATPGIWS